MNFVYLGTGLVIGAVLMATGSAQYRVFLQTRLDKLKTDNESLLLALKALSERQLARPAPHGTREPAASELPVRAPREIPAQSKMLH